MEGTCNAWFILSAKHGLVSPDAVLEPYDESLTGMSAAPRRAWAGHVLAQIDSLGLGPTQTTFEIHAGAHYRSFGLVSGLQAGGAKSRSSRSTLDRVSSSPSTVGRHQGKPGRYRPASSRGRTVREAVPRPRWPNTSSVCPRRP